MNRAVILHGKPTQERYNRALEGLELMPHDANWLPWLAEQLDDQDITTSLPPLPKPFAPDYKAWKEVFESVGGTDMLTTLVGHSAGAEFILRYLSEDPESYAKQLVLVAPYHDFERKHGGFSEYVLNPSIAERVARILIVYSTDDDQPILNNVERLKTLLPSADIRKLYRFGHFRIGHNMFREELPELLNVIVEDY
jgi:predicted alpha/beta hydrolase family esterase